ncbi:MAG: hypothetical protein MUF52_07120 [Syntrophobacteraceae bacterium]|jgi:hypothetical protein|nr:hypothetical protein [Syntrophobacteraceae bacterium]
MRLKHRFVPLLILLAVSSGCATAPVGGREVHPRLRDANEALGVLQDRIEQLYVDMETVRLDLRAFYQKPGWPEMRQIILTVLSADDLDDGDADGGSLAETATGEWSMAWREPWEDRFAEYLHLVRRCTALEARRIALQAELFGVQGKFLGVSVAEYSRGRYDEGRASDEVVEVLSRSAEELGSYSLDEVGLYDAR